MATPTPVLPAPPGQTSNFENPPSLVGAMNIAMAVAIPLTCFLFGIRTYVRLHIRQTWIVEDWLALVAWIGTVSFCGVGAGTMAHYGGRDGWDITATQAQEASYWFNVASIHYGITICIAKLAVLYLYRRVFSPHRWSPFDISIVFMIVLLILFYTAFNIVKIWDAPAFSLAGTIVRIQGSSNPDKTWVQPDIIMWGASILNGMYLRKDKVFQGSASHGYSATISNEGGKASTAPYYELDKLEDTRGEGQRRHDTHDQQDRYGEVSVTREVRVDSTHAGLAI
ncbi:integral membrane protein [Seiridium cupressi]